MQNSNSRRRFSRFSRFSILSLTCLIVQASLVVPAKAAPACVPAAKRRSYDRSAAQARANKPIDTVGHTNDNVFDPNGLLIHMEGKLGVVFQQNEQRAEQILRTALHLCSTTGRITNVTVWRASGDKYYDQGCQAVLNQASPFAANEDVERIECVAYFRTEPNGGSVQVSMPQYASSSSQGRKTNCSEAHLRQQRSQNHAGPHQPPPKKYSARTVPNFPKASTF